MRGIRSPFLRKYYNVHKFKIIPCNNCIGDKHGFTRRKKQRLSGEAELELVLQLRSSSTRRALKLSFAEEGSKSLKKQFWKFLQKVRTFTLLVQMSRLGRIAKDCEGGVKKTGRIDILVNNAGVMKFGKLETVDPSVWDTLRRMFPFDTNKCVPFIPWEETGNQRTWPRPLSFWRLTRVPG